MDPKCPEEGRINWRCLYLIFVVRETSLHCAMDRQSHQYHVEDVGRILLQAQTELRGIREQIRPENTSDAIDEVLQRAEADLKAKAELVLSGLVNNSMRVLPVLSSTSSSTAAVDGQSFRKQPHPATTLGDSGEKIQAIAEEFGIPTIPQRRAQQRRLRQLRMPKRTVGRLVKSQTSQRQRILPDVSSP